MGLCVRGALKNKQTLRQLRNCITTEEGVKLATVEQVREWLFDQLAMGREVLPFGQCDLWDWKEGCPGHERETNEGGRPIWTEPAKTI